MNRKQRRDLEKQVKRINKIETPVHKTYERSISFGYECYETVQNGTQISKDMNLA